MSGLKLIDSRFNRAISALTYGFNCLIWDARTKQLYECILSIHEDYINILHLIIARKVSYLLKLHEIYNISDSEFSTETHLRQFGICTPPHTQTTTSSSTPRPSTPSPSPAAQSSKNRNSKSHWCCSCVRPSYTSNASTSSTPSRQKP